MAPTPRREFVAGVLEQEGLSEARAISLDVEDFVRLLRAFHAGGLHFRASSDATTPGVLLKAHKLCVARSCSHDGMAVLVAGV